MTPPVQASCFILTPHKQASVLEKDAHVSSTSGKLAFQPKTRHMTPFCRAFDAWIFPTGSATANYTSQYSNTYHIELAIEKKYNNIKRIVHHSFFVPCVTIGIVVLVNPPSFTLNVLQEYLSSRKKPTTYAKATIK